ncbi:MAG: DoxX family protein [Bacteroidia bacterium]
MVQTTFIFCSSFQSLLPLTAVGIFLTILFIQSGMDKATDWEGNLTWLKSHFGKTFMKNAVPLLLGILLVSELLAGTACFAGSILLVWKGDLFWLNLGLILSCTTLLMLFFGQRIAKDYTGASALVPYFIVVLIGLILLNGQSCCL